MPRAPEITYYEELGVPNDASQEQIRDAFRALVRLLHPDHQTDAQLKAIAEAQMRKINRIYSVLSDPEKRRRYDSSLDDGDRARAIVFSQSPGVNLSSKFVSRLAWSVAGLALLLVVLVLTWDGGFPSDPEHPSAAQHTAPNPAPTDDLLQLQKELRKARAERDAAMRELARFKGPVTLSANAGAAAPRKNPAMPPAEPGLSTLTELPATPAPGPTAPAQSPLASRAPVRQFGGFWFYVRPPHGQKNNDKMLYVPQFIELSISEQNGAVHGRYRSRYQIADRPISPDVNFEFHGVSSGNTVKCPWTGPGGAKGDLTLQLTAENALSVEWSANELGSTQGLISGTAKLTRRIDN